MTRKGKNIICLTCKNEFYVPLNRLKRGVKYCSQKCYLSVLKTRNKSFVREKSPTWKGEDISYTGIHMRLRRYLGPAKKCVFCGVMKNKTKNVDWAHNGGESFKELENYIQMCKSCHKRYDLILGRNNVYHPELSNINPKSIIGKCNIIHSHVVVYDDVEIGDNCKIQSGVFIPNGIEIGDNVFIGPNVTFTNDKYPPSNGKRWEKTIVEEGVSIGAGSVILPGIRIGRGAMIGAGSVVTKDVPEGESWFGNPARFHKKITEL